MNALQFASPYNFAKFLHLNDEIDFGDWKLKLNRGHQIFSFFLFFYYPYNIQFTMIDGIVIHLRKRKNTIGELVLLMLYGILLDNLAWDPSVASIVFVSPRCKISPPLFLFFSFLVTEERLCFIANCSVIGLLVIFLSETLQKCILLKLTVT